MQEIADIYDTSGRCTDVSLILEIARRFGMGPASGAEIEEGRAIAAALIHRGIADVETFKAVHRKTGYSVLVHRENSQVTGMLGLFFVDDEGYTMLKRGEFDAAHFDLDRVVAPGDKPVAGYGWGFAATTDAGGRAAVKTSVALQKALFWATPAFTRTATPDGVRVILGKMGYVPAPFGQPDLVWIPPATSAAQERRAP